MRFSTRENARGACSCKAGGTDSQDDHLLAVRQCGHEVDERCVVLLERPDSVGVDAAAGSAGEVDAGDAVAGALEEAEELEPAPGAVAGTVHKNKVLLALLGNIAACVH